MKIAEVMTTNVATCGINDSLNRAAQLMWERRCGCLPVLDESDRAVGMLTDRDICMAAYTQGRPIDYVLVTSAMSRPLLTCLPTTTIEDAEDTMMAACVHRLVVIAPDGRVVGLVSVDDIARHGAARDGEGDIDLARVAVTLGEISRHTRASFADEAPGSESPAGDIFELVQNSLDLLKTLRDEIRVDIALAGKEARDRWARLEARLRVAETRAHGIRREGLHDLLTLVESAKELQRRLREEAPARPD